MMWFIDSHYFAGRLVREAWDPPGRPCETEVRRDEKAARRPEEGGPRGLFDYQDEDGHVMGLSIRDTKAVGSPIEIARCRPLFSLVGLWLAGWQMALSPIRRGAWVGMRAAVMLLAIIGTGCLDGRNREEPTIAEVKSDSARSLRDHGEGALREILDELPGLLVAEVPSKPRYDGGASQLILDVAIKVDQPRYEAIRDRLVGVLDGLARAKGSTTIETHQARHRTDAGMVLQNVNENHPALAGPTTVRSGDHPSCVWVADFSNKERTQSRWDYYVVDLDLEEVRKSLAFPWKRATDLSTRNPKQGMVSVHLSFLDKDGSQVTEDVFELPAASDDEGKALIRHGLSLPDAGDYLYIAPCFFEVMHSQASSDRGIEPRWGLAYLPQWTIRRAIKLSPDEAKRIEKVESKISLRPGKSLDSALGPTAGR